MCKSDGAEGGSGLQVAIQPKEVLVSGALVKIARLVGEFDGPPGCPGDVLTRVRQLVPDTDLFTFTPAILHLDCSYPYPMEWDNIAAINLQSYDRWLMTDAGKKARKSIRKAEKAGLHTRLVALDHELVDGIKAIFDEVPVRQGKPFWHYQKPAEDVLEMLRRDIERSVFLGAFRQQELVGFAKLLFGHAWVRCVQLLSKLHHRDKAPNNLLIESAVRVGRERGCRFLIYGQYSYGTKGSSGLTEFKKHNGFEKVDIPRYYVPCTWRGRVALNLGIHNGIAEVLPRGVVRMALAVRDAYYSRRASRGFPDQSSERAD
jgi:hypothetical protein